MRKNHLFRWAALAAMSLAVTGCTEATPEVTMNTEPISEGSMESVTTPSDENRVVDYTNIVESSKATETEATTKAIEPSKVAETTKAVTPTTAPTTASTKQAETVAPTKAEVVTEAETPAPTESYREEETDAPAPAPTERQTEAQTEEETTVKSGHWETVVVSEAWDEVVVVKEAVEEVGFWTETRVGGQSVLHTDWSEENQCWYDHWVYESIYEPIYKIAREGEPAVTETIHHDAVTKEVWVED